MPSTRGIKGPSYKDAFSGKGTCACRQCREDERRSKEEEKRNLLKKVSANSSSTPKNKLPNKNASPKLLPTKELQSSSRPQIPKSAQKIKVKQESSTPTSSSVVNKTKFMQALKMSKTEEQANKAAKEQLEVSISTETSPRVFTHKKFDTMKIDSKMLPTVVLEKLTDMQTRGSFRYVDDSAAYSPDINKELEKGIHEDDSILPDSSFEDIDSSSAYEDSSLITNKPKVAFYKQGKFKQVDLPIDEDAELDVDDSDSYNLGYEVETTEAACQADTRGIISSSAHDGQILQQSPLVFERKLRKKIEKLKTDIARRQLIIGVLKRNIVRKKKEVFVREKHQVEVRKRVFEFLQTYDEIRRARNLLKCDENGKVTASSLPLSMESKMSVDQVIRTVGAVFPKEVSPVDPINVKPVVPLIGVPFKIFLNKSKDDTMTMTVDNREV